MDHKLFILYIIGGLSVLAVSLTVLRMFCRCNFKFSHWLTYPLFAASGYIIVAQYLKYLSFHFYVDFSHWAQILYNISISGRPVSLSVELMVPGTINYLSVHFVPLIYFLAIPFKLWPYNETLIGLNFLLMISAVIPLYKFALICYQDKRFALFCALLLLWYPTFQYTILYEFEMLRFSIPIILWMLYFWQKRKMIGYYFFVLLAVLVREEVGLTIMMFGLYLIFIEKQRPTGVISALIGLGAFFSITKMVMPALRTTGSPEHIAAAWFYAFGRTPGEVIGNIILRPGLTLSTIFEPVKLANVFMLFLPLLFIPLFAPTVLISTLANLGVGILSGSITHVSYMLYYLSPSIPFVFFAFIKGWPRLLTWLKNWMYKRNSGQSVDLNSAAMAAVLSGLLAANVFFGPSPISLQFWFKDIKPAPFRTQNFHYSVYKITEHHRRAEEFYKLIPNTAVVSAEQFLTPRLYKKRGIMVFPQIESLDGKIKADYVFIDKKNPIKTGVATVPGSWDGLRQNPQYYYDLIEKDLENWKLVKSEDGYFLYQRIK